jgi:hypothetical protein
VESLPSKRRILEKKEGKKKKKERKRKRKRKEKGLKRKIGETSYEEAPCFKRRKKEDEIYKLLLTFRMQLRKRTELSM